MKKFMMYAVIFIVVFEIYAEIKKRLARKRLSREYGRVSKWDMKRHVDIGKLISLVIVAGGAYLAMPLIKKHLIPNIESFGWLLTLDFAMVFLRVILLVLCFETLKRLLMKVLQNEDVWKKITRLAYWAVFLYMMAGLWPFGRAFALKLKSFFSSPPAAYADKEKRKNIAGTDGYRMPVLEHLLGGEKTEGNKKTDKEIASFDE